MGEGLARCLAAPGRLPHGVNARKDACRRRRHERRAAELAAASPGGYEEGAGPDVERLLHFEIDRLPERYRVPIVLCDLEGRPLEQVARASRLADRDRQEPFVAGSGSIARPALPPWPFRGARADRRRAEAQRPRRRDPRRPGPFHDSRRGRVQYIPNHQQRDGRCTLPGSSQYHVRDTMDQGGLGSARGRRDGLRRRPDLPGERHRASSRRPRKKHRPCLPRTCGSPR